MMIRMSHFTRVLVIPLLLVLHFSGVKISGATSSLSKSIFSSSHINTNGIAFRQQQQHPQEQQVTLSTTSPLLLDNTLNIRGGFSIFPSGWNPMGYKITRLGEQFLSFDGTLETDVGRFLASLKRRKWKSTLKSEWLEILRASKKAQTMRVYRKLDELLKFCLKSGFIN
mmetsp:Transcript_21633/g.30136  ORF Transcript_21633/g.30136 Transcript_21633/m.30136 type:complete len:169 (+) Transcript_21633:149-655(+)